MRNRWVWASSTLVAGAIAVALILRPSHSIQPELASPKDIPQPVRAVLKKRMERHGAQMAELVSRLVVLDHDGAARLAGAIYDEPTLGRPLGPDELNQLLPDSFFRLQDDLKAQARKVVAVAARGESGKLAEEVGALTKICVSCHSVYLYERRASATPGPPIH